METLKFHTCFYPQALPSFSLILTKCLPLHFPIQCVFTHPFNPCSDVDLSSITERYLLFLLLSSCFIFFLSMFLFDLELKSVCITSRDLNPLQFSTFFFFFVFPYFPFYNAVTISTSLFTFSLTLRNSSRIC